MTPPDLALRRTRTAAAVSLLTWLILAVWFC